MDKRQIEQWVKEGLINEEQAQRMLADISKDKKEQSSNKFIIALSTIGAILFGIGIILFIASNWEKIPNTIKVLILLGITTISYYGGYILRYQRQTLIKVGASLIFLGALLFGPTVFLVAQIYHINANHHILVLIWLVGILPLVYALKTESIAGLSSLLFFIWIGLYVGWDSWRIIVLYLIAGILLFGIGGLHYLSVELKDIARLYRIAGIKVGMIALFILTFCDNFGISESNMLVENSPLIPVFVVFSSMSIIFTVINLFLNPSKSTTSNLECYLCLGVTILGLIFFSYTVGLLIYIVLFNLILLGVILTLLYIGYNREDIKLVNIGIGYLWILVVVRYCDFFWELLPRSIFFMLGGLVLVGGSTILESKRRELKRKFGG